MTKDIRFIDSQACVIDGEEAIYLKEHISLLRQVENKLSEIGAEKFFSDPNRDTQTAREALAGNGEPSVISLNSVL